MRSRPSTASGSAMPSPRAARPATTTRRWASPRAAPGSASSAISASSARDIQREAFTVAGIGDMSGDVFGNGMLLSRQHPAGRGVQSPAHLPRSRIRIRRAASRERERLFRLPRSGWNDYDRALLSRGGGDLRAQRQGDRAVARGARAARHLPQQRATPMEIIRAILCMPVDLLWNGGIGTYVKASERAPRRDRRPRQRCGAGRWPRRCAPGSSAKAAISACRSAAASNTRRAAAASIPTSSTTPPASTPRTSRSTSRSCSMRPMPAHRSRARAAIGCWRACDRRGGGAGAAQQLSAEPGHQPDGAARGGAICREHQQLLRWLERYGDLDRAVEFLPTDEELERAPPRGSRTDAARSWRCCSPTARSRSITRSPTAGSADDPYLARELRALFSAGAPARFAARASSATACARQIIITATTNSIVNRIGPDAADAVRGGHRRRCRRTSRAPTPSRATAPTCARCGREIEALDGRIKAADQYDALLRDQPAICDTSRYWLLAHRRDYAAGRRRGRSACSRRCANSRRSCPRRSRAWIARATSSAAPATPRRDCPQRLAENLAALEPLHVALDLVRTHAQQPCRRARGRACALRPRRAARPRLAARARSSSCRPAAAGSAARARLQSVCAGRAPAPQRGGSTPGCEALGARRRGRRRVAALERWAAGAARSARPGSDAATCSADGRGRGTRSAGREPCALASCICRQCRLHRSVRWPENSSWCATARAPGTSRICSPAGPTSICRRQGRDEARQAGRELKREGLVPDLVFTSVLKRAIRTQWLMLDEMDLLWLPVERALAAERASLRRAAGTEQGADRRAARRGAGARSGAAATTFRRRRWTLDDQRHPRFDPRYRDVPAARPAGHRVAQGHAGARAALLGAAHRARAARAAARSWWSPTATACARWSRCSTACRSRRIVELNIPTGVPLLYELDAR